MTVWNETILNMKWTLPIVLGLLVFELITKALISVICGVLHVDGMFAKLRINGGDDDSWKIKEHERKFGYTPSSDSKNPKPIPKADERSFLDKLGRYR